MFFGEALGPFRDKVNMRTLTQHLARGTNWIGKMLDAADSASAESRSVHDEGVELHFALAVEKAAATGIEGFVIFHYHDSFFDCIQRCAVFVQHAPALGECFAHAVEVRFDKPVRNGPRASVYEQNWVIRQGSLSKNSSVYHRGAVFFPLSLLMSSRKRLASAGARGTSRQLAATMQSGQRQSGLHAAHDCFNDAQGQ